MWKLLVKSIGRHLEKVQRAAADHTDQRWIAKGKLHYFDVVPLVFDNEESSVTIDWNILILTTQDVFEITY